MSDLCNTLCKCCPHNSDVDSGLPCCHAESTLFLKKLCRTLTTPEALGMVDRHVALVSHYLGVSEGRVKLAELQYFTVAVEFFVENLKESREYKRALWCLLKLCFKPPTLTHSLDAINFISSLDEFFTALGDCLLIVEEGEVKLLLSEVIKCLLKKERETNDVPYNFTLESVERGHLSEKLVQLLRLTREYFYLDVLELISLVVSVSPNCVSQFLDSDAIYWLLKRLPFQHKYYSNLQSDAAEQTRCILWKIFENFPSNYKQWERIANNIDTMRIFRKWLRKEVLLGNSNSRNNTLALISQFCFIFQGLSASASGIIEEFDIKHSWAGNVEFPPNQYTHEFKQILIATICYLFNFRSVRMVASEYGILPGLGLLIDPTSGKSETMYWPTEYRDELITLALRTLPILATYYTEKYMATGATPKILEYIEKTTDLSSALIQNCLNCLLNLILKGVCYTHFREFEAISIVLRLSYKLLHNPLTIKSQETLTYCLVILSELCEGYEPRTECHELMSRLGLELLSRSHKPSHFDSLLSGEFKVAISYYLWQCVVKALPIKQLFIQREGIYLLLDFASECPFSVQNILIGCLADFTEDARSIPQTVTWRGRNQNETVVSLLCSIYREQEKLKDVARDSEGCLKDPEMILEGRKQARVDLSWQLCPPVADMRGCARVKIYAVFSNILRRFYDVTVASRKIYDIDVLNVTYRDLVTAELINHYEYFKKGEIWKTLRDTYTARGLTLIPQVESALFVLANKHLFTAKNVSKQQRSICNYEKTKELNEENKLYDNLRSTMLSDALKALHDIKRELNTADLEFSKRAKMNLEREFDNYRREMGIDESETDYRATQLMGINLFKETLKSGKSD